MLDMKTLVLGAVGAALLAAPGSAQIVRHSSGGNAVILEGVSVPAGADTLMLSGQLASPIDSSKRPDSVESFGDTKTQTISALNKIKGILASRGYAMSDIIKMTVFVAADPKRQDGKMDFAGMNEGYRQFFGTPENPNLVARSTIQVAGLAGPYYLVEIEVTAAKMAAR
ncbi:RidA family protein [Sphingomonas quercus]|nr:RidA family protein [Sphingomonas quercus]